MLHKNDSIISTITIQLLMSCEIFVNIEFNKNKKFLC